MLLDRGGYKVFEWMTGTNLEQRTNQVDVHCYCEATQEGKRGNALIVTHISSVCSHLELRVASFTNRSGHS